MGVCCCGVCEYFVGDFIDSVCAPLTQTDDGDDVMTAPLLDHIVFNVRFAMDEAAAQFGDTGFSLTERGFHTLGSINHLMILDTNYLELIGLPDSNANRPEIADAAAGLNGLVFKTADVDQTYAHLESLGWAGDPPKAFSRPLSIGGKQVDATFRTVAVRSDVFPAGRVYFCEHGTPQYVWRDEWRDHANRAVSACSFLIVAEDTAAEAARYADLLTLSASVKEGGVCEVNLGGGAALHFVTAKEYRQRFGADVANVASDHTAFGAVSLTCETTDFIRNHANATAIADDENGRVVVSLSDFNATMEFVRG
jgi:hypothetical protein